MLGLISYHNTNMKQVLAWGTLKNYFTTEKYVQLLLKQKYKNADIFLSSLNYQFITEFEFDLDNLRSNNLCIGIDGEYWINTKRQKTETPVNIPLLPKVYALIQKYKDAPRVFYRQCLLPFMSNQWLNKYVKEITQLCGIKKELSFHAARHTFATTVTLTNGVPVETVSKMLGHTKLSTTQVYVHIVKQRISDDMKTLRQKLSTPIAAKEDVI